MAQPNSPNPVPGNPQNAPIPPNPLLGVNLDLQLARPAHPGYTMSANAQGQWLLRSRIWPNLPQNSWQPVEVLGGGLQYTSCYCCTLT